MSGGEGLTRSALPNEGNGTGTWAAPIPVDVVGEARPQVTALLDFLEDFYRLARPPVRDLREYGEFVLRAQALPEVPGVRLTPGGRAWLSVDLVEHGPRPEVPADLARWLTALSLSPLQRPEVPLDDDSPDDVLEAAVRMDAWAGAVWEPWAEDWQRVETARSFYKSLFGLRARLERDRDSIELVWGFGRLRMTAPKVDHPPVTVSVEIVLDDDGTLHVVSTFDPQIESAFLAEADLVDWPAYRALRQAEAADVDLWVDESRRALFASLLRAIDHDGVLLDTAERLVESTQLIDEWVLYVRRRQPDFVGFLDAQRELYRSGAEPSLPFLSLVVDQPSALPDPFGPPVGVTLGPTPGTGVDRTMYLPKPANEEQHRILELAQRRPGVTAQGPPGTGKSHTIANLICHFVAEGKRVLVTAEKEQALAVLSAKLPPAVRSLSVGVLGSDESSRNALEHAINSIQEQVSTYDEAYVDGEIRRLTDAIADLDRQANRATNELRAARSAEAKTLVGSYEAGVDPSPSRVADWLHGNVDLGFVPDSLGTDARIPLGPSEWTDFVKLLGTLDPADVVACAEHRPRRGGLPDGAELAREFDELDSLRSALGGADDDVVDWDRLDAASPEDLAQISAAVNDVEDWRRKIAGGWIDRVRLEAAVPLTREEWTEFLDGVTGAQQSAVTHRRSTMAYEVVLGELPDDILRSALQDVADRFRNGKGLRRLGSRKLVNAVEACKVDGRPPSSLEQVDLCLAALGRREQQRRLRTRWNQGVSRIGGPILNDERPPEDEVSDHLEAVKTALAWNQTTLPELQHDLTAIGVRSPADPTVEDLEDVGRTVEILKSRRRERALTARLEALDEQLRPVAAASGLWAALAGAFAARRWVDWDRACAEAARLEALESDVERLGGLAASLDRSVPMYTERLTAARGAEAPSYATLCQAFEWRRLSGWLDDVTAGPSSTDLQHELEDLASRRLASMENLVAAKAWRGLVASHTDAKRSALNRYLTALRRFGKTGGKYGARWMREIREALDESKDAVPVWIMPINRVLGSFRPDALPPFDVLIVDEASQISLFGLPVLALAKKAIVVGDDQQTSPENVGLDRAPVHHLVDTHLQAVRNATTLFDGDNSLYDVARQKFPEVVVLREHFRCLPDIISFSNQYYYDNRMIPLRDRPPAPGWSPVGTRFVPEGVRDGKDVNEAEAQAVVDLIAQLCDDPSYEGMTFGVVTMLGTAQSQRILDLLLERLGPEALEERTIRCGEAAAFQGDERDVVVISTVVDASRRIGAMTDRKSQRRINVAASRAQNQLWVVHSVQPEDFPTGDPRAALIRHCQNPIELGLVQADLAERCESKFERDVLTQILARGYRRVRVQHEVGRYRIDIVVEGPDARLAIECDGDAWHGPERWDDDRQRQQKLERAGWTFERVRGSAFYRNPDTALDHLWTRLDELGIPTGDWTRFERTAPPPLAHDAPATSTVLPVDDPGRPPTPPLVAPPWDPPSPSRPSSPPRPETSESKHPRPERAPMHGRQLRLTDLAPPEEPAEGRGGSDGAASPLAPYRTWVATDATSVLDGPSDAVASELVQIVGSEGPMHALRAYQLHAKAAGGQRVGREMRHEYNRITMQCLRRRDLTQIEDGVAGLVGRTLYLPGSAPVAVRELGPRALTDVPRSEIQELLELLQMKGASPTVAKRSVLDAYALVRLTERANAYLDEVLSYSWRL
jgi:very-short-patch-repair endonuclease